MPVYEYTCQSCRHKYESMKPFSRRDEPPPCPKCGGMGSRQFSAFTFKDGRYGSFYRSGAPTTSSAMSPDKPGE